MMPAYIAVPSEYRDAYRVAPVVAAIPLGRPDVYAVTAVNPESPLSAPTYVAAEVELSGHGSWYGFTPEGNLSSRAPRPGLPRRGQTKAAQTPSNITAKITSNSTALTSRAVHGAEAGVDQGPRSLSVR